MSPSVRIALFAGLGGLLLTLANIAASLAVQPDQPLPHPNIILAMAIFFILGFVLNFGMNKELDIGKAIIIGIAAPGIITNIVAGAANNIQKNERPAITPSSPRVEWNILKFAFGGSALAQITQSQDVTQRVLDSKRPLRVSLSIAPEIVGGYGSIGYESCGQMVSL